MQTQNEFKRCPASAYSLGRNSWRTYEEGMEREWLITNGIGGYASLTVMNSNARSFSGLLNASLNPPADRYTLLANVTETITFQEEEQNLFSLSSMHKISETLNGQEYLTHFEYDAYPAFTYQVEDLILTKRIGMKYGENTTALCYEVQTGERGASLAITPYFTFKPLGSTCSSKDLFFSSTQKEHTLTLSPDVNKALKIHFYSSNGSFIKRSEYPVNMAVPTHENIDGILYDLDIRNGLNTADSYATPYDICIALPPNSCQRFYLICSTQETSYDGWKILQEMSQRKEELIHKLPHADSTLSHLVYSADQFIVLRESTNCKTILAGYPWFLDWGRDTMIAFTGLTLSTRRFEDARSILLSFVQYRKNGLLPNVFPDQSNSLPQYNTMDASLWYFQAVYQYLQYDPAPEALKFIQEQIDPCLQEIIHAYQNGTDFHIRMDEDGLVLGGDGLEQITWMDVRIGDWVVTPRHGKPVEINALWYNALRIMEFLHPEDPSYHTLAEKVRNSFVQKFWNDRRNCLNDVIWTDENGVEHTDETMRPNQIFTVSLPFALLDPAKEKAIVSKVYQDLYTPLGLRSLSAKESQYKGKYIGPLSKRDAAYHMGTSWAFLTGPLITAYLKVHAYSENAVKTAYTLITPMLDHLQDGCLGGVAEIFDGDSPCTSRGCYTQAWSVGELLRIYEQYFITFKEFGTN